MAASNIFNAAAIPKCDREICYLSYLRGAYFGASLHVMTLCFLAPCVLCMLSVGPQWRGTHTGMRAEPSQAYVPVKMRDWIAGFPAWIGVHGRMIKMHAR
jgi:hypothetical protein